ncbi:MAG TPA: hypothetical protein V6C81_21580 [Planktothrix sp.]
MSKKLLKFFRIEQWPPRAWFNWTAVIAVVFSLVGGIPAFIHGYQTQVANHVSALQALLEQTGGLLLVTALMCFMFLILSVYVYETGLIAVSAWKGISSAAKKAPAAWASFRAACMRGWSRVCSIPAAFGRGWKHVRSMDKFDWLAILYGVLSLAMLVGYLWLFWGPAAAIVRHAPHWIVGSNHDRIFMTGILAYLFSILPWSFSAAIIAVAVKSVGRRTVRDTKKTK